MGVNAINDKYRPRKFSELVGQAGSVQILTSALEKGKLPPAYLFMGIRGAGKTTSARLLALSLNCENKKGIEPCCECFSCKDILEDSSEYLLEIDGATNSGVANVRELNNRIRFVVDHNHYKIVVIDECHMLSTAAWNAFLKTIEEPPSRVLFVFCTTEFQKVPATIKSRCVRVPFVGVLDSVISDRIKYVLTKENVPFEDKAISIITKNAQGSIRDAQSILEGFIHSGKVTESQIQSIYQTLDPNSILNYMGHVVNGDLKQATYATRGWLRLGALPETVISELLEHFRNMIMDFTIEDPGFKKLIKAQRDKIGDTKISEIISFFYDQLRYIKEYPMAYTLSIDLITIKLIDLINNVTTSSTNTRKKKPQKEQEQKDTQEPTPTKEKPDVKHMVLPLDKIRELCTACNGRMVSITPDKKCVTILSQRGTKFDVVFNKTYVVNDRYVLVQDLSEIIKDYPQAIKIYGKRKN